MLVLAMQLDEARGQLFQRSSRGEYAIDECAAAPLSGDFTTDDQLLSAVLENRFDRRCVLARPHQVAGSTAAKQQTNGFDEDRLPCPGFTGEDVESGVELHLEGVDDGEVTYFEKAEHERAGTPIVT